MQHTLNKIDEFDGIPWNCPEKFETQQYYYVDHKLYKHENLDDDNVKVIDFKEHKITYITVNEFEQLKEKNNNELIKFNVKPLTHDQLQQRIHQDQQKNTELINQYKHEHPEITFHDWSK